MNTYDMLGSTISYWIAINHPEELEFFEYGFDLDITFMDFYLGLKEGICPYDLLGTSESETRFKVMSGLATILNVEYDEILNLWINQIHK